jgi:hypothetical protein
LNDDDGLLRFVDFEILNASSCHGAEAALRTYLVGRALADVDFNHLRETTCTGKGECVEGVIREVQRYQALFAREHVVQSTGCHRKLRRVETPGGSCAPGEERAS